MDYGQIIKRSWEIVKKNKFLWWLGILAAFAGSFGSPSFNFSGLRGFSPSQSSSGTNMQSEDFAKQVSEIFSKINVPAIIAIGATILVFILIIYLVVLYFSLSAKAGLIISVNRMEKGDGAIGFRSAMREGRKYFWKLFGLGWLVILAMSALIFPIFALIFLLIVWHPVAIAISLGLLIFIGFIAVIGFSFVVSIVLVFTQIMIVLENKKVFASIRDSYKLIKRNLKDVAIGYAIMMGVSALIGLMVIILMFVVVALLILGGVILFFANKTTIFVYAPLVIAVSIVFFAVVGGFVTAFTSTYWTLFYRALGYVDSKKIESGIKKEPLLQAPTI